MRKLFWMYGIAPSADAQFGGRPGPAAGAAQLLRVAKGKHNQLATGKWLDVACAPGRTDPSQG
jgi:hypothetical protein